VTAPVTHKEEELAACVKLRVGGAISTGYRHPQGAEEAPVSSIAALASSSPIAPGQGASERLHAQFRISGMSSPFLLMYCLCSISLFLSCCFR
jgi:hypothetical protein